MIPFAAVLTTGVVLPESILITDAFKILQHFSRDLVSQSASQTSSAATPFRACPCPV